MAAQMFPPALVCMLRQMNIDTTSVKWQCNNTGYEISVNLNWTIDNNGEPRTRNTHGTSAWRFQKKSPSTIRRDFARLQTFLSKKADHETAKTEVSVGTLNITQKATLSTDSQTDSLPTSEVSVQTDIDGSRVPTKELAVQTLNGDASTCSLSVQTEPVARASKSCDIRPVLRNCFTQTTPGSDVTPKSHDSQQNLGRGQQQHQQQPQQSKQQQRQQRQQQQQRLRQQQQKPPNRQGWKPKQQQLDYRPCTFKFYIGEQVMDPEGGHMEIIATQCEGDVHFYDVIHLTGLPLDGRTRYEESELLSLFR